MKALLLLPFLLNPLLPVQAAVDPEIHKICLEARDYSGCVEARSNQTTPQTKVKTEELPWPNCDPRSAFRISGDSNSAKEEKAWAFINDFSCAICQISHVEISKGESSIIRGDKTKQDEFVQEIMNNPSLARFLSRKTWDTLVQRATEMGQTTTCPFLVQ